ncbi:MAG: DMT family transporter [Anaerolineae bacterium]
MGHTIQRPPVKLFIAIPCILLAALLNALMGASVKASSAHVSTEMIVLWRNLVSLVLLFPWICFSSPEKPLHEKLMTRQWGMQLIRSLSGLVSVFLYFYSLRYLSLSDATLLFNTMPIFVPITAYLWKKHPIPHRLWWGIGLAFAGVAFVIGPSTQVFQLASLLAIGSGMAGSVATFALRLAHYTEPSSRTLFYYFFISTIVTAVASLFQIE